MKFGGLLLAIGLALGLVVGILIGNGVHTLHRPEAGLSFVSGMGLGLGAAIGLVLMIWLLKTCDRYLAAANQEK
jgi:hypothetical protein